MTKRVITAEVLQADEGKVITLDGIPQGTIVYKPGTDMRKVGECTVEEAEAYFAQQEAVEA